MGISSGANFLGAVKAQNALGASAAVVTVFSDSNKKYLSTDLLRPEPVKDGYLSPDIEIVGFRALARVFNPLARPWVRIEAADAEAIIDAVRRCPTGALRYHLAGAPDEAPDTPTTIEVIPNGARSSSSIFFSRACGAWSVAITSMTPAATAARTAARSAAVRPPRWAERKTAPRRTWRPSAVR